MHIYIYDNPLSQKKYDKILAKIETKITDLGLNGRIIRLGPMNSVFNAVENEIKKGAKTIVSVGSDNLFSQVLNSVAMLKAKNIYNNNLPMGIIPIGKENNDIAHCLGINSEEEACNILSARRIQQLDIGQANYNYFLGQAIISTKNTVMVIDDEYTLESNDEGEIRVINLPIKNKDVPESDVNAVDNQLQLLILSHNNKKIISRKKNKYNLFRFKKLVILNKNEPVIIDGSFKITTPVEIKIAKEKINLIVGRNRKF